MLSRYAIGDLATQYFADRDIFCAGRVSGGWMWVGGWVQCGALVHRSGPAQWAVAVFMSMILRPQP